MTNLLAKQGVTVDSLEAGALDAALVSLSVEQRIAVKSQLMRAGLAGLGRAGESIASRCYASWRLVSAVLVARRIAT